MLRRYPAVPHVTLFGRTHDMVTITAVVLLSMVAVLLFVWIAMRLIAVLTRPADVCPGCSGTDVRQSYPRPSLPDWVLARLACVPIRCRSCRRRYYARRDDAQRLPRPSSRPIAQ